MKTLSRLLPMLLLILASCEKGGTGDAYFNNTDGLYFEGSGDQYNEIEENPFIETSENAISTFSIDADGGSYANVRRFLQQDNQLPVKDAVRTEELINYFELDYPQQPGEAISLNGEISSSPWSEGHRLLRIGVKGKDIPREELGPSNFVFLIDVSGSMGSEDKLEMLKNGFKTLTDELSDDDRIAIVTYAGESGVLLPSTPGSEKSTIKAAISKLGAGGSTAGAAGIMTAYEIAEANFIEHGNNRIVIGTDGDFNVGPSSQEELTELIEQKRESGVFITVLGVGRGNLQDGMLEQIANKGNGTYEYIDNVEQMRKVFLYDFKKFYTAAKDIKIQVEFSPKVVQAYRLIGYENRVLNTEDFEDDEKDAGEIGINQNITALYEIIPAVNADYALPAITVDCRYKLPDSDSSLPISLQVFDELTPFSQSSGFMKFSAGVASFGMLLRDSEFKGDTSYEKVLQWLQAAQLPDEHGYKAQLQELVQKSSSL
ncbi:MAG: von Willebrand factor type A domain-containing protein [Christiangramia sp.]|uniref:vWA domain-containing protein n=1 Tax=Christiangramia sp. TaxID=1931228 RepID=UPI003241BFA7